MSSSCVRIISWFKREPLWPSHSFGRGEKVPFWARRRLPRLMKLLFCPFWSFCYSKRRQSLWSCELQHTGEARLPNTGLSFGLVAGENLAPI